MWYKRVVIFVNGRMPTYDQIICPYFGLGPTPSIFKSTDPQRSMGQSPQKQQQQKQKRQSKNKEARSSRTEPAAEQRLTKQWAWWVVEVEHWQRQESYKLMFVDCCKIIIHICFFITVSALSQRKPCAHSSFKDHTFAWCTCKCKYVFGNWTSSLLKFLAGDLQEKTCDWKRSRLYYLRIFYQYHFPFLTLHAGSLVVGVFSFIHPSHSLLVQSILGMNSMIN